MKTNLLFTVLVTFLQLNLSASNHHDKDDYGFLVTDYTMRSKWDAVNGSWISTIKQTYIYNKENLTEQVISINLPNNDTASRVIYYYDESELITVELFQNWTPSGWINVSKYLIEYDGDERRSSLIVLSWKKDIWVNISRQFNFTYDIEDKLVTYVGQNWAGNDWVNGTRDSLFYSENGNITSRVTRDMSNNYITQYLYSYDNKNLRTLLQVKRWQKLTGSWLDLYHDTYTYNSCGTRMQFIRTRFTNGNWINELRDDYYYQLASSSDTHNQKVSICHNGHTIYVSHNAVPAHLAHGDCIGECIKGENRRNGCDEKDNAIKPPFTVFPNPAKEKITIKFNKDAGEESKRVELTDFYGKLLNSFNIKDNNDLTIYRNNLPDGKYYIMLIGKEVKSTVVIFK